MRGLAYILCVQVKLTKDGVRVFNMPSRNDSIIVTLTDIAQTVSIATSTTCPTCTTCADFYPFACACVGTQ
jgi:hypothetical protein